MSTRAAACPACGWRRPRKGVRIAAGFVLLPVAGFTAFALIYPHTGEGVAVAADRGESLQCWEEQRRPELDRAFAQALAERCLALEARFERKWGRRP